MKEETKIVCPRCQIGVMQPKKLPYSMIENGQLVSVPNMSARICDVCNNRIYDRDALINLRSMLGATRRKPTKPSMPKKAPSTPRKPKSNPQ